MTTPEVVTALVARRHESLNTSRTATGQPGVSSKLDRCSADAGERITNANHIDGYAKSLRREPHILSGRNRMVVKIWPEIVADHIACSGRYERSDQTECAQHGRNALVTGNI